MTYEQTLEKLYNLSGARNRPDALLARLGDPQRAYPSVLVGGTNGKGSVCLMLAEILRAAGHRVGLFTSPHLVHPEERIRVNEQMIAPAEFQRQFERVWQAARKLYGAEVERQMRFFPTVTAMALDYFARQAVDWAVIEVGVGGRRDATAVVHPVIAAVTNVELDHTEELGETIAQIAWEKAGIVPAGGVLLTTEEKPEARAVMREECAAKGAQLVTLGGDACALRETTGSHQVFDWRGWKGLELGMLGQYQLRNAALALAICAELSARGARLSEGASREGLRRARWPGRMEFVQLTSSHARIILDGAKNPAGLAALRQSLESLTYDRLWLVLGFSTRKDIAAMVKAIVPGAEGVIATRAAFRGVDPDTIAALAAPYAKDIRVSDHIHDALEWVLQRAKREDLICVTGSLFLVGEARAALSALGFADRCCATDG